MTAKLNLAPEVYQANRQAKRRKQLASTALITVGVIAGGFVGVLLIVFAGQRAYEAKLSSDIKDRQSRVEAYSDLPKAATLAQHLDSLTSLYKQRVQITKFFDVLQQVTPQGMVVTSVGLDESNVLTVSGSAGNYGTVTKFVKALEAQSSGSSKESVFSDVQLSAVSRSVSAGASFQLTTKMASEVVSGNK
jgi:Tfp pilus assembly protein PilN